MTDDKSEPDDSRVLYDCTAWSGESRRLFRALLEGNHFQHVWQGTTVSVRAEDEESVDDLVDEVMMTATPTLDPTAPRMTYEVSTWSSALQTEFTDQLTFSEVPYEWDQAGNVVVLAADEALVDEVVEMLPDEDESGISSDDGVAVHELLDDLFMRADRLSSRPNDASATVAVVEGTSTLEQLTTPFGFSGTEWKALVGAAQALRDAIEGEGDSATASDQDIAELAVVVRDIIRRYT
ncbi:MAG TPA: hypothetical protein VL068_05815 [Microthrixaceae bacterium]|nr:hypothetical protein [Microthrixaceae bacterium]